MILKSRKNKQVVVCVKCEQPIPFFTDLRGNGVCPWCGMESGSYLCEVKMISYKKKIEFPGIKFWKRKVTLIGANELSNDWILNHKKRN